MAEVRYERNTAATPQAHSVELGVCDGPECKAIHVILVDINDNPIASCSLGPETVAAIARISMTLAAKARA